MSDDTMRSLSVVMERRPLENRWIDHKWEVTGVLPDRDIIVPQCLFSDVALEQWVFPALPLRLYRDEVDNYLLNLSTETPSLFVVTRLNETTDKPEPAFLTVSYGEAARMMDASETVTTLPLPTEVWRWVMDFSSANFRPPEPKKEKRYAHAPGTVHPIR